MDVRYEGSYQVAAVKLIQISRNIERNEELVKFQKLKTKRLETASTTMPSSFINSLKEELRNVSQTPHHNEPNSKPINHNPSTTNALNTYLFSIKLCNMSPF